MSLRALPFVVFCLSTYLANAQFKDDFSDGILNDAAIYQGAVDNFIVNDDFQLQLNAPEAGNSSLFVPLNFTDSISWELDFVLDFAPSNSNNLEIVLWSDSDDLAFANAYTLQMGETGSEDAINFIQYLNGQQMTLATGSMGAVATDPVEVSLKITKSSQDEWLIRADYNNSDDDELLLSFSTDELEGNHFFGFVCEYSSTRVDKFFFDNICIGSLLPDTEGPLLVDFNLIDDQTIVLNFDEPIDPNTVNDNSKFEVDQIGNPSTLNLIADRNLELGFSQSFLSGVANQLSFDGVEDLNGNSSLPESIEFFLVESPMQGDLIINEILFDPFPNGTDFIELYNNSEKILDLSGISIANLSKDEVREVTVSAILQPFEYILFSEDTDFMIDNYVIQNPLSLQEIDLPSYNNDSGNFSILSEGVVIDSFDYTEDFHFVLIDDTEGVSLERLSFDSETNAPENWNSAASIVGFATPGYRNSNQLNINPGEEMFALEEKVFSPNEDGEGDALIITYDLGGPGFVGTVRIFDSRGREEVTLLNNELLSSDGFVKWNGVNAIGERSPIGIYIVYISVFNEQGDTFTKKMSCVLADFLN